MIKVSGYSDDIVVIEREEDGKQLWEEEYDSYDREMMFLFDDGTIIRVTYNGAWQIVVEEKGTALHTVEKLVQDGDYYSDLFTIWTDTVAERWKE